MSGAVACSPGQSFVSVHRDILQFAHDNDNDNNDNEQA